MTTTFSFKALKAPLALKRLYIFAIMSTWVPYGSVVRAFSMQAEKDSGSNPAAVDIKFKPSALVQQAHPLYRRGIPILASASFFHINGDALLALNARQCCASYQVDDIIDMTHGPWHGNENSLIKFVDKADAMYLDWSTNWRKEITLSVHAMNEEKLLPLHPLQRDFKKSMRRNQINERKVYG
uniref:Uncharacterized protein n=1 Tax=Glossina palpalis gambiensis TaxID=67801 RepID=A0A1B0AXQ7_9MUSC